MIAAKVATTALTSASGGELQAFALAGVEQKLPELGDRPRILTFNYDTGERYLSVPDFLPEQA